MRAEYSGLRSLLVCAVRKTVIVYGGIAIVNAAIVISVFCCIDRLMRM